MSSVRLLSKSGPKYTPTKEFSIEQYFCGPISTNFNSCSIAGFLIIPMRSLSKYLTDRIGNYEELAPNFHLYPNLMINEGVMSVLGVEHDRLSTEVILIPKGKDGNSKKNVAF